MKKHIIIIGAGIAGKMIAKEFEDTENFHDNYFIEGFFDDDKNAKKVLSFNVIGIVDDIPKYASKMAKKGKPINEAIIAIPSIEPKNLTNIISIINKSNIKVRIIPPLFEIIKGEATLNNVRDIEPSDLLGREEIGFDEKEIDEFYNNKSILVTGGAGSIGSEIVRQLLNLNIKKVVVLDYNENSIYDLMLEHQKDNRFSYVISNINDNERISNIIKDNDISIVFHAAAHKHLPIMENCPTEAIKNNIIATKKLLDTIIKNNIKHFLFISTDKAVRPTSIMGASKRICERIILSFSNRYKNNCLFKIARFGNVLGSNGSVIPIFSKQIKNGGPITITDPNMIRYFMSIREAARLVIKSVSLNDGNIFVLDMGKPVRILDLAKNMIALNGLSEDDIKIEYIGIREGEKLYEEVLMDDDALISSPYKKLFIAKNDSDILSEQEVDEMIEKFENIKNDKNKATIIVALKKYIPDFKK